MKLAAILAFTAASGAALVSAKHVRLHHHHKHTAKTWENCHDNTSACGADDECVTFSPYYSQCLPSVLVGDQLCGQNDGKEINWKYDYCQDGWSCVQQGNSQDFRCKQNAKKHKKHHQHKHHQLAKTWEACTGAGRCYGTDTCVYQSPSYSQCMPEVLVGDQLCGQYDGKDIDWLYDYCQDGWSCEQVGNSQDLRCKQDSKKKHKKHHHKH